MKKLIVFCMTMSLVSLSFGQNVDGDINDVGTPQIYNGPVWNAPARGDVLYDNGQLANSLGTGSGGADESVLQNGSLGLNLLGWGHQILNDNAVADDFTADADWHIDTITFFAYQTNGGIPSTINDVRLRIWDGDPSAGGSIVWGDRVTNVLSDTAFSNIYRVTETTGGATNRAIMANTVTVDADFPAGTYWLDWQVGGVAASGPWAPPITITGQTTTGNGLQQISGGAWAPALDSGTNTQQGFPFIITGSGACEITSLYLDGTDLNIYGLCTSGVDIWYSDYSGNTLVANGVIVDGSTSYDLGSVAPDAIYYVTPAGSPDDILASTNRTVPTLGEWGMIFFVMLLAASGVVFMRKRRMV